jgi:hypothetical protein
MSSTRSRGDSLYRKRIHRVTGTTQYRRPNELQWTTNRIVWIQCSCYCNPIGCNLTKTFKFILQPDHHQRSCSGTTYNSDSRRFRCTILHRRVCSFASEGCRQSVNVRGKYYLLESDESEATWVLSTDVVHGRHDNHGVCDLSLTSSTFLHLQV